MAPHMFFYVVSTILPCSFFQDVYSVTFYIRRHSTCRTRCPTSSSAAKSEGTPTVIIICSDCFALWQEANSITTYSNTRYHWSPALTGNQHLFLFSPSVTRASLMLGVLSFLLSFSPTPDSHLGVFTDTSPLILYSDTL